MPTYGLTSTGYVRKGEVVLLEEMQAEARALISPSLDLSEDDPLGQVFGIFARKLAELEEGWEAAYNAISRTASGNALDRVAQLTGAKRRGQAYSTVVATVNVDPGVTKAIGSIIATVDGNADARFVSSAVADNSGGGVAADIAVTMVADTPGAVAALSGTLTQIEGVITGVNSITNASAATLGYDVESDGDFRQRRDEQLEQAGSTTLGAMRADILALTDVGDAKVFTNRDDVDDADGRPPHSFEALVFGGDDSAIAQAIWDSMPLGIQDYSDTADSGTAVDDEGNNQTVNFSRPTAHRIYVRITLETDVETYAGDDAVKDAIEAFSDGTLIVTTTDGTDITGQVDIGGTVYRSRQDFAAQTVAGVTGVTLVELSDDGVSWSTTDTELGAREYMGTSSRGIKAADITVVGV